MARIFRHFILGVLLFVLAVALVAPKLAVANSDKAERAVEVFTVELEKADKTLMLPDLKPDRLQKLRSELDKLRSEALTLVSELEPDVQDAESQLEQLGPKPQDVAEDQKIAEKRAAISAELAKLKGIARHLDVTALKASQLSARAAELERTQFFEKIFKSSQSVLNPDLWYQGAATIGEVSTSLYNIFARWISGIASEAGGIMVFVVLVILGVSMIGGYLIRRLLARFIGPDLSHATPSDLGRLWRVFRGLIINVLSVIMAFLFAGIALQLLEYLPHHIERIGLSLMEGSILVAVVHALSKGVLAPSRPSWRLAMIDDARAHRLRSLLDTIGVIVASGIVLREIGSALFLKPESSAPISAFVALGVAGVLSMCLLAARQGTDKNAPEVPFDTERLGGFAWVSKSRIIMWLLVLLIVTVTMLGYLAFGRFIATQLVMTGSLVVILYLAHHIIDELVGTGLAPGWVAGDFLRRTVGLGEKAVSRLGLLIGTLSDFLLFFIGLPIVATQWAYNIADFKDWITTVFFGFKVGGVTISFATIVAAFIAFFIGLIVTRLATSWLDERVLARTQIDRGIRNSIRTGAGYLGFAIAAMFALSYAGLDFSNIAIVAGALGVGIGFGLQSIVNNFVSGLILLAERPIKVGDWISVSGGEGHVTQINVRSTEIKTFDNCSVIVPNSSLISEPVRNWTHEDTRGRVKVAFGVAYDSDPQKVKKIALECVEKIKEDYSILLIPEPHVVFMDFGASSLDFQLRLHIPEVGKSLGVASALRFEILDAFRKAGIAIPFPQQDIHFRDIDRLEAAISGKRLARANPKNTK